MQLGSNIANFPAYLSIHLSSLTHGHGRRNCNQRLYYYYYYHSIHVLQGFLYSAEARRRMQQQLLLCYCTEAAAAEAQSSSTTTTTTETTTLIAIANSLDIRVGRIVKIWRHEEADSLYVEEVDVGEPQPRTICSGLVKYIPIHLLQDKNVIVLANLKPRNMRGVKSSGMLMAASDASHENVELLVPPEGALPGERVWFGSVDQKENLPECTRPGKCQKKKIWELIQPHLRTDESCVASLGTTHYMRTSAGPITSQSLNIAYS
ncbi:hypothetical protein BUALT_Bualt14G0000600 [Buddleja alternifolia]|uniref:tRNA-binding domain-containing protein n=1 Tax=Buddleja alternifolia TaxID=168488 RepID=A0AAV6WNA4_9LAMI|nr:hypothetical protein BUALT_Bualt14G0000600 [Buddleja alternifolia]